jgi:hypothetical protein
VEAEDPRPHPRALVLGLQNTATAGSRSSTRNGRRLATSRCSVVEEQLHIGSAVSWRRQRWRSHVIPNCHPGLPCGDRRAARLAGHQDNPLPSHRHHQVARQPDPGLEGFGWRSGGGSAGELPRRAAAECCTREGEGGFAGCEDHDVGWGFSSAFPQPPSDETSGEAPRPSPGGRGTSSAAARPRPAGCAVGTAVVLVRIRL